MLLFYFYVIFAASNETDPQHRAFCLLSYLSTSNCSYQLTETYSNQRPDLTPNRVAYHIISLASAGSGNLLQEFDTRRNQESNSHRFLQRAP